MWTTENRARYDRNHLRYPSDVTDAEWALIEPCLPYGLVRLRNNVHCRLRHACQHLLRTGEVELS